MVSTAQRAPPPAPKGDRMFVALRLGPVTRAPMYQDPLASSILPAVQGSSPAQPVKYPRIIVRDFLGRTLDTYTTLQEAIYRASWTRRKMGDWPRTPLEWRLPKAPAPAKPDYSRSGPLTYSSRHDNRYDVTAQSQDSRRMELTANVLVNLPTVEIAVDDVSFVAESLNQLPNLPSFTFLRHSLLAGQATYVQIVASILLHQKQLRELDRREAVWSFPGFCTGCQRAGLCYGCSKSAKPHVHEDIPAMTGGGFRFWKRDRPRDPHLWKHPGNWKVPSSEEELKSIIERYGDLASYQRAMMRAGQRMADTGDVTSADQSRDGLRYQRLKSLGTYPPRVAIVTTDDFVDEMLNDMYGQRRGVEDMDGQRTDVEDMDGRELDREDISRGPRESRRRRVGVVDDRSGSGVTDDPSSDPGAFRVTVRSRGGEEVDELRDWIQRRRNEEDEDEGIELERRQRSRVSVSKWSPAKKGNSSPPAAPKRSRFEQKPSDEETEELTRLLRERAKENVPFGKKRRDVSYQAPKFFTVQKTSRHVTVARDPFSDKRDLDLPKGPAFQLKKSERKTTKFVEFKKGERGWKAPKKFEVKHEEKQPTKFWQGSSPSRDRRSRRRRGEGSDDDSSERRRRQNNSLDSGIASGSAGETDVIPDVIPPQPEHIATEGQDDKNQDGDTNKTGEVIQREPVKVKRREVVKKTKVERPVTPPPKSPPRLPSPPPVRKRTPPAPYTKPPTKPPPPSRRSRPCQSWNYPRFLTCRRSRISSLRKENRR
ncbi:uncharacterized protein LOC131942398 isoform X2 [Physella acuta]|uniref:uncharacterized protein LOC131942398 isoform X2 n=1 Tax=Physella acuta TaxID=109671 RepID=UPI0027DCAFEE|nr:uncharacterized protein LOC131942398 isoform X2 [Physella acuta]